MEKLTIEINENVLKQATEVLEDLGMDVQGAIRMFMKRIVREQSVAFVLPDNSNNIVPQGLVVATPEQIVTEKVDKGEMRKTLAIKLFKSRGQYIDRNVTYSSKNRTTYNYWSNPNFSFLEEDWSFILNDWVNRKLYLFKIPKNSIRYSQLTARNDQPELIDIQIFEDDPTFTDKRSDYSFRQFLADEVNY